MPAHERPPVLRLAATSRGPRNPTPSESPRARRRPWRASASAPELLQALAQQIAARHRLKATAERRDRIGLALHLLVASRQIVEHVGEVRRGKLDHLLILLPRLVVTLLREIDESQVE